jgi:SPP1 family predicted phage head-tail adaptor
MQAGKLNRRISIQSQTTAQDAMGQEFQAWSEVWPCWASIEIQNSQLLYSTAEFVSKVTTRITFRYTTSVQILPNMRIVFTEQSTGIVHTYEIQALVNDKQADRQLMALCYELNAAV